MDISLSESPKAIRLLNGTEAYLTLLYIQALTNPDSNIQYIIIMDDGTPIIIQPQP